jgi:peptide/nickel transport system substrate-binding protein
MKGKLPANRRALAALTAALTAAGVVTGTTLPSSAQTTSALRAAGSVPELVMESSPENSITQNFNPWVSTASAYGMGATGLIYEPLLMFDLAAPPKYSSWLATKYKWSHGGRSITFTIRTGATWNDGKPFGPADVAFTFDELKQYPDVNLDGLKISSVSTSGDTVTVNFPTPQYTNIQAIAGTGIVPQHIWATVGDPAKYVDANPVGTGPTPPTGRRASSPRSPRSTSRPTRPTRPR